MKIYDCFSYWDEDLLLEARLNIMNDFVDYFVIVEGNKTWQNNPKQFLTPIITQTIIEHVININFQFISFCFILIATSIWAKV